MQTCSVVIPVYKVLPNEDELISYSRCLFVLRESRCITQAGVQWHDLEVGGQAVLGRQ